jgi:beta-1,4-N-acetylglucosaminyltransferase
MILVTVGTGAEGFDSLIEEVDRLVKEGHITEDVYAQIGHGKYEPIHIKQYRRFVPSLDRALDRAQLVISHAGAGIVQEVLSRGIKLIAIPNDALMEEHQKELAYKIKKEGWALVCTIENLLKCFGESKTFMPYPSVWYQWKKRKRPTTIDKY